MCKALVTGRHRTKLCGWRWCFCCWSCCLTINKNKYHGRPNLCVGALLVRVANLFHYRRSLMKVGNPLLSPSPNGAFAVGLAYFDGACRSYRLPFPPWSVSPPATASLKYIPKMCKQSKLIYVLFETMADENQCLISVEILKKKCGCLISLSGILFEEWSVATP